MSMSSFKRRARSVTKSVKRTLKRYSLIVGLLLVISLSIKVVNTSYLCLSYQPADIPEKPPENMYTDAWNQTIGYWGNNLTFGTIYFFKPVHGIPKMFVSAYEKSNSNFTNHYAHGAEKVWGYLTTMNVHGIIEVTGIFLMIISGFLFWAAFLIAIFLALMFLIKGRVARKTSIFKKLGEFGFLRIKEFPYLLSSGMLLIIIAAPIEAYLSWPVFLQIFVGNLWLSLLYSFFLIALVIWLFFIKLGGHEQIKMARDYTKLLIKHLRLSRGLKMKHLEEYEKYLKWQKWSFRILIVNAVIFLVMGTIYLRENLGLGVGLFALGLGNAAGSYSIIQSMTTQIREQ